MREYEMLEMLENLNPAYIEAAAEEAKPKTAWVKWGMMAACLCLVASFTVSFFQHKIAPDSQNPIRSDWWDSFQGSRDPTHAIAALEYNGKYYEVVDIPEILEKYGLPPKITADMAGKHLSYLKPDDGGSYEYSPSHTDIELYQYAPSACDGVYIVRDGDTWYAALFCNFLLLDSSTSIELTELYRVYGIESADNIASIAEMSWDRSKVLSTPVTARQEITDFYDMTVTLRSYSNDDFQKLMFGVFSSEESQQQAHIAFADDYRCLRIETADGLRFFIGLHPSYDWIDGGGTMSYYRIDEQLHEWIDRNLD